MTGKSSRIFFLSKNQKIKEKEIIKNNDNELKENLEKYIFLNNKKKKSIIFA